MVYGQPAIAVPVGQVRARAIISARPDQPKGWVHIQAPNIGLEKNWDELSPDHPLIVAVKGVLKATSIAQPPAMIIGITSTIPVAAGLGSGAAVSVALIRALSEFLGQPFSNAEVSALAFEVEKLYHGTPSGIDNTVITFEKPFYFIKQSMDNEDKLEAFQVSKPFTIVIGDSGVPSLTSETVGDVRKAWQQDKKKYEALFKRTGEIVDQARAAIEMGDRTALGPLLNENQALLEKMGVSSEKLEHLIRAARQAGALGAKLSGGGRGGNIIALAERESADLIAEELIKAGATRTIITDVAG